MENLDNMETICNNVDQFSYFTWGDIERKQFRTRKAERLKDYLSL